MPNIPDFVYQFHKKGGYDVSYLIINQETGTTSYYQYMTIDGYWYILKAARNGATVVYTYTTPVNTSASTGWTNRSTLVYADAATAFSEG